MTKKEVRMLQDQVLIHESHKKDKNKDKSPWVSEQDRLEAMASSLGHVLDGLANDLGCE